MGQCCIPAGDGGDEGLLSHGHGCIGATMPSFPHQLVHSKLVFSCVMYCKENNTHIDVKMVCVYQSLLWSAHA